MVFGRNPEKYETRALQAEQRGKLRKAQKNRDKAARLRASHPTAGSTGFVGAPLGTAGIPITTTTTTIPTTGFVGAPLGTAGVPISTWTTQRTPAMYEQRATKWESRGNWNKAQKNREKVWRLQNPQWINSQAPSFYTNNRFTGYNMQPIAATTGFSHMNAPIVETHVRPTIIEQTTRAERIVEVQPIIHREIDAPQVRVVERHMYETVPSAGPAVITKGAIVEETVKPRIIEEVQPVIHREVPAPFVERVEQHVTEHIVRPTTQTKEVIQERGIAAGGVPIATTGVAPAQQHTGLMGKINNTLHR